MRCFRLVILGLFFLFSCKEDSIEITETEELEPPVTLLESTVSGRVKNQWGQPLIADIVSFNSTVKTDGNGVVHKSKLFVGQESAAISISHPLYSTVYKTILPSLSRDQAFNVVMRRFLKSWNEYYDEDQIISAYNDYVAVQDIHYSDFVLPGNANSSKVKVWTDVVILEDIESEDEIPLPNLIYDRGSYKLLQFYALFSLHAEGEQGQFLDIAQDHEIDVKASVLPFSSSDDLNLYYWNTAQLAWKKADDEQISDLNSGSFKINRTTWWAIAREVESSEVQFQLDTDTHQEYWLKIYSTQDDKLIRQIPFSPDGNITSTLATNENYRIELTDICEIVYEDRFISAADGLIEVFTIESPNLANIHFQCTEGIGNMDDSYVVLKNCRNTILDYNQSNLKLNLDILMDEGYFELEFPNKGKSFFLSKDLLGMGQMDTLDLCASFDTTFISTHTDIYVPLPTFSDSADYVGTITAKLDTRNEEIIIEANADGFSVQRFIINRIGRNEVSGYADGFFVQTKNSSYPVTFEIEQIGGKGQPLVCYYDWISDENGVSQRITGKIIALVKEII